MKVYPVNFFDYWIKSFLNNRYTLKVGVYIVCKRVQFYWNQFGSNLKEALKTKSFTEKFAI